ncbi:MAG: sulfotransferase [Verrucomicrobia bacterium]|nr:sulfotransferase [Verrucomicrobiota bacterium]
MIYIVSGLPRSGTSLMMQMLEAGGIPPLTDSIRSADEDNPQGYYELEKVKRLRDDDSWLNEAEGKVMKVISMLLYDLPNDREYKVVFMQRNMDEILASQQQMLKRRGNETDETDDMKMRLHFENHLSKLRQWIQHAPHINLLYCDYNQLLADPVEISQTISAFLGGDIDSAKMADAVNPDLYRQRKG